ncbi:MULTISPECIES: hypothetical protein [unclassified Pseudomonas]|uniref:hypothetical protein n=1 Tax=unclassified Pseudomonas TaxID=196821 RepID=UPI00385DAE04
MAQHGSPGIHAGRPTPRNLHSASRTGRQIKIKSQIKIKIKIKIYGNSNSNSSCR